MSKIERPDLNRPAPLNAEELVGDYLPDAALVEILAAVAGASSWAQATPAQRQRVGEAVERLRTSGLSPRTLGLVGEARVAELQGMEKPSARAVRSRDKALGFPPAVVTGRLWDEADVERYLQWRVAQATSPRKFKNRYAPERVQQS